MRVVILGSGVYSETVCAMAVRLADMGCVPVGVLSLRTLHRQTLLRKLGQWGIPEVIGYARIKLTAGSAEQHQLENPYLRPWLEHSGVVFRNLREVAKSYGFPIAICGDQNSPHSISLLRSWSPDLIVFAGGNILRKQLLSVPRLGVLNVHLGLLPQIRGMSSPEWSLLNRVAVGITIHYMDAGIDSGPILQRYDYPKLEHSESLADLRHRLVAFGVEKIGEAVDGLDRGIIVATLQTDMAASWSKDSRNNNKDHQHFVVHEWLQARAEERLTECRAIAVSGAMNG
jgi:folate-dependent phosphoribosylglycinamide formyltransferase PurN